MEQSGTGDAQYGAEFPTREFPFMVLRPRKPKPGAEPRRPTDCLKEAPEFDLESFPRRVVMSRELPPNGARCFVLLDSPGALVERVASRRDFRPHDYIVVEPNTAVFLFLDIDVDHHLAPPAWTAAASAGTAIDLVGAVCSAVRSYLSEQTGLTLARWVDRWLPYQSRRSPMSDKTLPPMSKTSFHVHAGLASENVLDLGERMEALGRLWTVDFESELPFVCKYLFQPAAAKSVVDLKVYNNDRNFRLPYSSKAKPDRTDVKTPVWKDAPAWSGERRGVSTWAAVLASAVLCRNSLPLWSLQTVRDQRLLDPVEKDDYGPTQDVGGPSRDTQSFRCLPTVSTVRELEEPILPRWEREPPSDTSAAIRRYLSSMLHEERPPPAEIAELAARSGRSLVAVLLCIGAFALPGSEQPWRDADQIVLHASDIADSTTPEEIAYHCLMAVAGSERDYSHNTLELKRTEEWYVEEVLAPWLQRFAAATVAPLVEWFSLARIALSRSEVHRLRFLSTRPHSTLREDALQLDETTWARAVLRAWSDRRGAVAAPRPLAKATSSSAPPPPKRLSSDPYDETLYSDSPKLGVDADAVLRALAPFARQLCTHLLGSGPTSESAVGELRWGRRGSLVVYLPGSNRGGATGWWKSFEHADASGNLFKLIIHERRFRERVRQRLTAASKVTVDKMSFVLALRYAVAFLRGCRKQNIATTPVRKPAATVRTEQDRVDDAQRLWRDATPAGRARVESYLTGRRRIQFIETALVEWRFHERFPVAGVGRFPAILCPFRVPSLAPTDSDESVRGVHAILLSGWENGRTPLVDNSKRTVGCMHDSAIPVARLNVGATVVFVAEGCETALSVLGGLVGHELFAKCSVWAVAGKSNFAHFAAPPGTETLYVCADNDGKGDREMREVALLMAQRHPGVRVLLLMPPLVPAMEKSDFNDWQCHLQDAVPWRLRFVEMLCENCVVMTKE